MQSFSPPGPLQTPVLLVIFNRPETTALVFEAIRKAKPPRLYIAADGPRPSVIGDQERCSTARAIVKKVDWECDVKTLFHDKNLNCGVAPSTAFTWFFKHEEAGIILEDDCLPSQSFFWYCEELLQRFRYDDRVMHIGGNNFLNGWRKDIDYSYYFSRSGHIWGWATWRRAWQEFDFEIKFYKRLAKDQYFNNFFLNWPEKFYRLRKFKKTAAATKQINWWDYQWDFTRYINSGLSIVPQVNLVKNIGFNEMATHTRNGKSNDAKLEAQEINVPLSHPPFILWDKESDMRYFKSFLKQTMISKLKYDFA
jgi:hypothetical protein